MVEDEADGSVVGGEGKRERREQPRERAYWRALLETRQGSFECRVLNLSPGGAMLQLAQAPPQAETLRLILEPLGEFAGVVAWRRQGTVGMRITGFRAGAAAGEASGPPAIAVERCDPLELLRDVHKTVTLQAGEVLFKEGDLASCLYIVKSGTLRIKSGEIIYEDVGSGGIVGEMGLVEQHKPRSATVYALSAAEVLEIDERRFFSLVERTPNFALAVMRVLSRRLRHMDHRYRPERWTGLHR